MFQNIIVILMLYLKINIKFHSILGNKYAGYNHFYL